MVKPSTIKIGRRVVGEGRPCFVIAEGGVNHNGDPLLAEELVHIAARCKADAVKFQKRTINQLLTRAALERPYVNPNSLGATYGEHRLKLELAEEYWYRLRDLATSLGLEFMGSAWDRGSADLLEALGTPAIKTPSAVLSDLDLLDYIARKGRPMIVSTGMSGLEEVDQAVDRILRHTEKLILLQCTSAYPSEFADINLRVMDTYRRRYGVLVGYSGHERGIAVSEAAATLGACVVERHFTKDRTLPGPDQALSLEPIGLEKLVRDIRHIEVAMGSAEKSIAAAEWPVRARLGKSVVAARHIAVGSVIRADMLTAKSPGDGIPANHLELLIGRVAAVEVSRDTLLPAEAVDWDLSPAPTPTQRPRDSRVSQGQSRPAAGESARSAGQSPQGSPLSRGLSRL
ncbi:MAG TPA: N-acetylneuraminate synthase family protein, partial [Chloroflexota bacterium]|nr:N-acetylneuraminate synthase family protein [Chloroflexota bacterium]